MLKGRLLSLRIIFSLVVVLTIIGILFSSYFLFYDKSDNSDICKEICDNSSKYMSSLDKCGNYHFRNFMLVDSINLCDNVKFIEYLDGEVTYKDDWGTHKVVTRDEIDIDKSELMKVLTDKQIVNINGKDVCLYKYKVFDVPVYDVFKNNSKWEDIILKDASRDKNYSDKNVSCCLCFIQEPNREYVFDRRMRVLYHLI